MSIELVPFLLMLVGALFVVFGVRSRRATRSFEARAEQAPGVVTAVNWRMVGHNPGDRTQLAFPVLRFTTADGRPVEAEAAFGTAPPRAREGEPVTVMYDPADPSRPRLSGTGTETALALIFTILGAVLIVAGVALFAGLQALPDDLLD